MTILAEMFFISTRLGWSKLLLGSLLLLFGTTQTVGQVVQSARIEFPVDLGNPDSYQVVSAGEKGLVAYRGLYTIQGSLQIELTVLDTSLQVKWRGFIPFDRSLNIVRSDVHSNHLFLLLKKPGFSAPDFLIVRVELENSNYSVFNVRNMIPFNPTEFIITDEAALLGGYFNYTPLILFYNFATRQSKILPGFFNEPGELNQTKVNDDGTIDIVVSSKNMERKKCLTLRNYDSLGNLVKTVVITPGEKKNLIFGRSVRTSNGEQVVTGVYGRYADYSRGVFIAVVNPVGEYVIRYYNYSELQHFFSYMRAAREKRIKQRIERRKIKGKKIRFNYRVIVHDIIPYNNQFVLLGEAFYPHYTYNSNSRRSYNPFGSSIGNSFFAASPMTRDGMVFDGYQYTHAVVIGFDQSGKIVWDNSFEINDVRTMQLDRFVKIQAEEDRIALLYLFRNTLRSKIIKNSEVLEGKTKEEIEAKFQSDKIKEDDTDMSRLDNWYGRYFFAHGVQTVRNTTIGGVDLKRKVFFINKITYK